MTTTIARTVPPQRLIDLMNPVVRAALQSSVLHGALDGALLVLHVPGRKSGHIYDIPVGYADLDGRLVIVTQHRWRANLRGAVDIDVTHRGRRQRMRVELDEDPPSVADTLHLVLARLGRKATQRLTGLKLDARHPAGVPELARAAHAFDLATLVLTPEAPPAP